MERSDSPDYPRPEEARVARDPTVANALKDLGMRIGVVTVVPDVSFGLGYVNRTDLFGLSALFGAGSPSSP